MSAAICDECWHPAEAHGPNGCDVEVSDWGQLDCGCEAVYVGEELVGTRRLTPEGGVEVVPS